MDTISDDARVRYRHVLEPLKLGSVTIPNRIVRTAHQTGFAQGEVNEDLIAYHVARARGGVGMSLVETVSVHPSSPMYIDFSTDAAIDGMSRLTEAVQPYGMKLFIQLWHGGANSVPADGSPPWSSSAYPTYFDPFVTPRVPIEMSKMMIDMLVEAFRDSALRAVKAGLDGLELHAGHDYMLMQFLSPVINRRTDDYGGSLENRSRFLVEILDAIRGEVGYEVPLGVRFSSTDFHKNGWGQEELAKVIGNLQDRKLVDYVNLSIGSYLYPHMMIAPAFAERGYQLKYHQGVNEAVKVPRIVTGRIMTLDEADKIIAEGKGEMISMVRALIAEPNLVRKSLSNQRPRTCISCNTCAATNPGIRCSVNPAVGFETTYSEEDLTPTTDPKTVVIAGGGPAGMEAARISALRGHRVTLFEASDKLGGQINLAASIPGRKDMGRVIPWFEEELDALKVDVRLSTCVTADLLAGQGEIDVIVNATGPRQRTELLQTAVPMYRVEGGNSEIVKSSWDVLAGAEPANGRHALVLDDAGFLEGAGVALVLLDQGWQVTFVTRAPQIAPETHASLHNPMLRERLYASGRFSLVPYAYIHSIEGNTVDVRSLMEGGEAHTVECDLVVPVMFHTIDQDFADMAGAYAKTVRSIGDALAPHRLIHTATREGSVLGCEI